MMDAPVQTSGLAENRKRYALFVSIPLIGHLNPLLPQAEELARRGWHVAVACTSEVRAHVEQQSPTVEFLDLGPMGPLAAELRKTEVEGALDPVFRRATGRIVANFVDLWPIMYDALCPAIKARRPDVMIVSLATFAGMDAADREGIPFLINNPFLLATLPAPLLPPAHELPALMSGKSPQDLGLSDRIKAPLLRFAAPHLLNLTFGRRLNALRRSRGRAPVDLSEALKDKLILTNTAFGLEYSRPLPALVQMVGPMISESKPLPSSLKDWLDSGPPVVYVNLGTLASASRDVLLRVLAALGADASNEFRVLWVLNKDLQARLATEKVPPNIRIESWVPSTVAVLAHEKVRVFVSHCGVNSIQESLYAGTPIVGIPILAGQLDMAARIRDAGVGLTLDKSRFTKEELRGAVLRVLRDDSFRRPIPALQSSFELAGGARRAADLIEHFVAVGTAHYAPKGKAVV